MKVGITRFYYRYAKFVYLFIVVYFLGSNMERVIGTKWTWIGLSNQIMTALMFFMFSWSTLMYIIQKQGEIPINKKKLKRFLVWFGAVVFLSWTVRLFYSNRDLKGYLLNTLGDDYLLILLIVMTGLSGLVFVVIMYSLFTKKGYNSDNELGELDKMDESPR